MKANTAEHATNIAVGKISIPCVKSITKGHAISCQATAVIEHAFQWPPRIQIPNNPQAISTPTRKPVTYSKIKKLVTSEIEGSNQISYINMTEKHMTNNPKLYCLYKLICHRHVTNVVNLSYTAVLSYLYLLSHSFFCITLDACIFYPNHNQNSDTNLHRVNTYKLEPFNAAECYPNLLIPNSAHMDSSPILYLLLICFSWPNTILQHRIWN